MGFTNGHIKDKPRQNKGLGDDRRKNTRRNIAEMATNLGSSVRILGFDRSVRFGKNARARAARLVVGSGGEYHNPAYLISQILNDLIKRNMEACPVRVITSRNGEVCNLPDRSEQLRSIAALLIKRYRFIGQPMGGLYVALRHRLLSNRECLEVLEACSKLGPADRKKADEGYLKILLDGGEDVSGLIGYEDKTDGKD